MSGNAQNPLPGILIFFEYLKLDLDVVRQVISFLDQEQPKEAVSRDQALMASAVAKSALSLPGPEGFAKEGRPAEENLDVIKVSSQGDGGTSAAYLAARLKKAGRDDLLEEVKAGEIRSIRAAAIEAGKSNLTRVRFDHGNNVGYLMGRLLQKQVRLLLFRESCAQIDHFQCNLLLERR